MRVPRHLPNAYERNFQGSASASQLFNGGVYSPAFFSAEEAQVVVIHGFPGLGYEIQRSVTDPDRAVTGAPTVWAPVELQYLTDPDDVYHAEYSVNGDAWWRVGVFTDTLVANPTVTFGFNAGGHDSFDPARIQNPNTAYLTTFFTTSEGGFMFNRNYPDGATGLVVSHMSANGGEFPLFDPVTGDGLPLSADPNHRTLPPSRARMTRTWSDFISEASSYSKGVPFTVERRTERHDLIQSYRIGT